MSKTKQTALITGASTGIGAEFARVFAAEGYHLILVARSEDKLTQLATELGDKHDGIYTVITADLGKTGAAETLFDAVTNAGFTVDVLVNNAGLLHNGDFKDVALQDHLQLLQVNIAACTSLAWLCLQPMLDRGHGRILNVASTSSFNPVPKLAAYAASKAYLLSLSESMSIETKGTGVTVTALCPGFTETPMIAGAKSGGSMQVPFIKNMTPAVVARQGYEACIKGLPMYINGFGNWALVEASRYPPRPVRRWLSALTAKAGF